MDIIEEGFSAILERIKELKEQEGEMGAEIRSQIPPLLKRMAAHVAPIIPENGLSMMIRGKLDTKREIYDAGYFPEKMLILGKTDPVEYRPDDPSKKVESQYCVLGEDGTFYELMYSSDGFIVDSYRNPLSPEEVVDLYGLDILYMLYRALREYMKSEEELVSSLSVVLAYIGQDEDGEGEESS